MSSVLNPYLNFDGNCREAMEFYQSILGGELQLRTFEEFKVPVPEEQKNNIMHASLENGFLTFMASDAMGEHAAKMGDNISMSISGSDEEKLRKYFEGLSSGGQIEMPLKKEIWGDTFGMLKDKFGIRWMVNISAEKPK